MSQSLNVFSSYAILIVHTFNRPHFEPHAIQPPQIRPYLITFKVIQFFQDIRVHDKKSSLQLNNWFPTKNHKMNFIQKTKKVITAK